MGVSQEMYTRIYRLYKRDVNSHRIAATLNIPLRTVQSVISRLATQTAVHFSDKDEPQSESQSKNAQSEGFLDIYFYPKTRYTIIQFVGVLTAHYSENIDKELGKALKSNSKAIALQMADVTTIDQTISKIIITYYSKFTALSKYFAILDPSTIIEPLLKQYNIEDTIPVFGTERAFEDNAFSKKSTTFSKRI